MGNKGKSQVFGIGDIHLKTGIGCKLVLKDVRHVSDLRLNLISSENLDDEGYNSKFDNGQGSFLKDLL